MAHAHDRTLLSSLGFSDPDKRDSLHDLACHYITTTDVSLLVVGLFGLSSPKKRFQKHHCGKDGRTSSWEFRGKGLEFCLEKSYDIEGFELEYPIEKGEGKYKTSIGFADIVLHAIHIHEHTNGHVISEVDGSWIKGEAIPDSNWNDSVDIGIEVKIKPVPVGDIIRQIKLYRSYSRIGRWAVVTRTALYKAEQEALANETIRYAVLGNGFDEYLSRKDATDDAETPQVLTL